MSTCIEDDFIPSRKRRECRRERAKYAGEILRMIALQKQHWLASGYPKARVLAELVDPQPLASVWGGAVQQLSILHQKKIRTVGDVRQRTLSDIKGPRVRHKTIEELQKILAALGYWFSEEGSLLDGIPPMPLP